MDLTALDLPPLSEQPRILLKHTSSTHAAPCASSCVDLMHYVHIRISALDPSHLHQPASKNLALPALIALLYLQLCHTKLLSLTLACCWLCFSAGGDHPLLPGPHPQQGERHRLRLLCGAVRQGVHWDAICHLTCFTHGTADDTTQLFDE